MALNPVQSGIYCLIKEFVKRQRIAFNLLSKVRPDLISMSEGKKSRPSKEYIQSTQFGQWGGNKQWTYLIHGRGCRMIHKITGERIEWNAPDLNRFDPYWFANWVDWALSHEDEFEGLSAIKSYIEENDVEVISLVFEVLDRLQVMKKIIYYPKTTNMYGIET